jgi:hemerythrin superfamily protein
MKKSNAITQIMVGDHALIEVLLIYFKDSMGKNVELTEEAFDKFRWELEKHIFVEEKVIFRFCKLVNSEMCQIVQSLAKQHDVFFEILNEMKNDLVIRNNIDILKLQKLFVEHRKIEEAILYPKLDEQLNERQKEMMIAQINEIPISK